MTAPASAAAYEGLAPDRFRWVGEAVTYWARQAPARTALGDPHATLTYGELEALIEAVRLRLAALGTQPGDRVLIVLENSVLAVVALLAAARLGAWAVPLNARLSPAEIDTIREHCDPRITIYTEGVSADAQAHAVRHGAARDDLIGPLGGRVALLPDSVPEPATGDPAAQVAALIYTSGTAGAPKGVLLTHDNLTFISARSSRWRRLSPADRVYGVLPVSHVFGLVSVLLGTLYQGGRLDLVARFVPEEAARALAEDGITVFQGAPQMHARLLALAKSRGRPVSAPTLRYTSAGGAPLDLALKQQIEAMWGLPLHNGYGLSETSAAVSLTAMNRPAGDHSCGPPLPDVVVRVAAPDSSALPPGEVGEIQVRGRSVMQGYYRDPALTAATITAEGWLKTGDLGRLDPQGDLYVEGRLKELIIRSGFNVYPPEVETVLTAHPDVALSAVLGRPVPGNEEVVAFVQPVPGRTLSLPDLEAFVEQRLAPYKRPSEYRVLAELPATATGKLLKARLRDLLQQPADLGWIAAESSAIDGGLNGVTAMRDLDPSGIMEIGTGYWRAKVLLSAVGLGLFTALGDAPLTRREVQEAFGLQPRPAADFLDGLVAMGLLLRDGDGDAARYMNTPETAHFLDRHSPAYIGGILELWEARNFRFWADLTEALKTGRAQSETKHAERPFFETLYEDPARLDAFMSAMTGASIANFELLAQRFPFHHYRTLTDVGGANGLLSRLVAKAHPHMSCTTFDLPAVTAIAARDIAGDGLEARVSAVAGDFFEDPLPAADVVTMGMILHDWDLGRKKELVRKAYDALPEGGALVAIEALIDDARRANAFGLMMSLNMLIELGDAFDFTGAEFRSWCAAAGFRRFEVIPLAGPSSAAVAYK